MPSTSSRPASSNSTRASDRESYIAVALAGLGIFGALFYGAFKYADALEVRSEQVKANVETVYDVSVAETDRYPKVESGSVVLDDGRECDYRLSRPSAANPYGFSLVCESGPAPRPRPLPQVTQQG